MFCTFQITKASPKQIYIFQWIYFIYFVERRFLKKMKDFLQKKRLIKARKSGSYSRLLQRYRKKWQLAKTNRIIVDKKESVLQKSSEYLSDSPAEEVFQENQLQIDQEMQNITDDNRVLFENSRK